MTIPLLDRLDADPGGARRFVADLLGQGASNAQISDALKARFGGTVTPRQISTWRNNDPELLEMLAELEKIKRGLAADDETNPADLLAPKYDWDTILFDLGQRHPAFNLLLVRDPAELLEREADAAPAEPAGPWDFLQPGAAPVTIADEDDPVLADVIDVLGIIDAGGTPEEFEAACLAKLGVESVAEYRARVEHPVKGAGRLSG